MKRGFILGKFMPLHQGHLFLIEVASKLVDQLTVLVCTRECDPIDGSLRFQWVQDSVKPSVKVVHLHQDIPQEPADHPDFWAIWQATIKSLHPDPIDLVFGSENYILKLAEVLSAEPIIIDPERENIPISATAIREASFQNWFFLPGAVRPYYQKRVGVLGAESTGKTTLCERLAKMYNTKYIPEYGRTYDASFRQGKGWQADDFVKLARTHLAITDTIAQSAGPVYFEDTDLLQTQVWAEYLLGYVPAELEAIFSEWEPASHYLLLASNITWINDGTRYSGNIGTRKWFFSRLDALLRRHQCRFSIVDNTSWEERCRAAGIQVDLLLGCNTKQTFKGG